MMKRITIILLLLYSTGYGAVDISVTNYSVDSSTTTDFASRTIGHPRWNIAAFAGNGDVGFYMSGYPDPPRGLWKLTYNIDSTVPWVASTTGAASDILNHGHINMKNDFNTAILGLTAPPKHTDQYQISGVTLLRTTRFTWPAYSDAQWFVAGVIQLGSSDTLIAIGRGGNPEHPKYAISTDAGANFGDTIRVPSNASPFAGPTTIAGSSGRIGAISYNGTAAIIYDYRRTDSDSCSMKWWEWNRATRAWDDLGHPLTRAGVAYDGSEWYRSFAGNAIGTKRFVVHHLNNINGVDSILYAYRSPGDADWTRGGIQTSTVQAVPPSGTDYPFVALTYIQSSGRLVMFYTRDNSTSWADRNIYMRYWDNTNNVWSAETRVSRYPWAINVTTCQTVPTAHGDVAYAMFAGRNGSYYYAEAAKVTFTEYATTVNITALPYTISQSNTTYTINGTKLTSATDGLTISANVHDIIIEGNNDTIAFGTAGTTLAAVSSINGDIGITTGANTYNVTIRNLYVLHTPPANIWSDSTLISCATALRWNGAGNNNYTVSGCTFRVIGRNSRIMWADNSGATSHYNNYIYNCIFIDSCASWLRRDFWNEQVMINLQGNNYARSRTGADFQYHWKFEGCSVSVAFWSNLHLEGDSTVAIIENNYWQSDGWNRLDNTPLAGSMTTATENYCIAIRQGDVAIADGVRVKVRNNRLRSGTAHSGGRGIFVSGVDGINWNYEDSCLAIIDNDIRIHQGNDGYTTTVKGMIFREGFAGALVTGNYIEVPIYYGTPPNNSYGPGPSSGIEITANPGWNLNIKGNTIATYFVDAFTHSPIYSAPGAYPIFSVETWMDSVLDGTGRFVHDIRVDSNRLITNHTFIRFNGGNGSGGNPQFIGDTFQYYGGTSPNNTNTWFVQKMYSASPASNPSNHSYKSWVTDPVLESGISETHIVMDDTEDDSLSIGIKATLAVTVRSSTNQPVSGATVTIIDRYGITKASGTTDGSGVFSYTLPYYQQFSGLMSGVPDSTYNPYVVQASYISAGTATTNHTLTSTNKAVTLYLGSVPETPAEPRTKITGGVHISGGVIIP